MWVPLITQNILWHLTLWLMLQKTYDFTIEQASAWLKATAKAISKGKIPYHMGLWQQKIYTGHQSSDQYWRIFWKVIQKLEIKHYIFYVCHYEQVNSPWPKGHTHVASGIVVLSKTRESGTIWKTSQLSCKAGIPEK